VILTRDLPLLLNLLRLIHILDRLHQQVLILQPQKDLSAHMDLPHQLHLRLLLLLSQVIVAHNLAAQHQFKTPMQELTANNLDHHLQEAHTPDHLQPQQLLLLLKAHMDLLLLLKVLMLELTPNNQDLPLQEALMEAQVNLTL
jgi:hypothetical protein